MLYRVGDLVLQFINMYYEFKISVISNVGTAVAQWLRRCTTNRKVAGAIPAGAIGIFH